jgi:hypothetical protein
MFVPSFKMIMLCLLCHDCLKNSVRRNKIRAKQGFLSGQTLLPGKLFETVQKEL